MSAGPKQDYTKLISGASGANGHKLTKTQIIPPKTSAIRRRKVKILL